MSAPVRRSHLRRHVRSALVWLVCSSALVVCDPPNGGDARAAASSLDGHWSQLAEITPGAIEALSAVYDPVRARTIIFGGYDAQYPGSAFSLTLDGSGAHWTRIGGAGSAPPARFGANMVYDSLRDRVLLFGGTQWPSVLLNDVWALSLTPPMTWTPIAPSTPGPKCRSQVMIYDPIRDRLIVFCQYSDAYTYLNGVWQLSLSGTPTWTLLAPEGTPPPYREDVVGVYDAVQDRLVIFGGYGLTGGFISWPLNDTWALTLSGTPTWTKLTPDGTLPAARCLAAGCYDPVHDQMIVMGGAGYQADLSDAFLLSLGPNPAWSSPSPEGAAPSPRASHAMVFDPVAERGIVLGGADGANETMLSEIWELDLVPGPAWRQVMEGMGPSRSESLSGIYDPRRKRFVIFGGGVSFRDPASNELWELPMTTGANWRQFGPSAARRPPGRTDYLLALDTVHDRLLLFGGSGWADAWAYDNVAETWSELTPTGTPPVGRSGMGGFYDAARDRLVFMGGSDSNGYLRNDVWELDFEPSPHWAQILPDGVLPTGRRGAVVAHDVARDRMLVFGGGGNAGGGTNDLWSLNLTGPPRWTRLTPWGDLPAGAQGMASMVDPVRHRLVIHGGLTGAGSGYISDTHALDLLADPPGWSQLATTFVASGPGPRAYMAGAYDAANDRLLIFGGEGIDATDPVRGHTLGDTFALTWGDTPTPTLLTFADEQLSAGTVRLTWYTPDGAGQRATAYRSADGTSWEGIASLVSDVSGEFVLEDQVPGGGRFEYRLGVAAANGAGEQFTDGHWVTIPTSLAFALDRVTPNPSRGALAIDFRIAEPGPVSVDIVSVAGRRVVHRGVNGLVPGEHTLRVTGPGELAPGVYLLRLAQGAKQAIAKVAVVR